jgi:AcrR family transcriptional regulator
VVKNVARRRGPGRPPLRSDAETRALIIDAAAHEFLAGGYAGTGVETIARRAGVSTRTVYRLIPTKEDLLTEALQARVDASFDGLSETGAVTGDLRESLESLLVAYARLVLSDDAVMLTQLIVAERRQVPAIVASYQEATMRVAALFEIWVRKNQAMGRLRPMDPVAAALVIRGMVNEAQRQILLGWRGPMDEREQEKWIRVCADIFLAGAACPT